MEKNTVERFGLEPVPKEQKITRWYEFSIIQFSFSSNMANFLVPSLAVIQGGLSMGWALFSMMIGAALAHYLVSAMSYPGSRYSIPAQFAMRAMLGIKGARYVSSPVRFLTSLYWFSVQIIGGTLVIQALFEKMWNIHLPFLSISLTLGIFMSMLAVIGFDAVKNITRYGLPILIAGAVTMLYVFLTSELGNLTLANAWNPPTAMNTLKAKFFFAGLIFIQFISDAGSSADLARYAKTPKGAHWGLFIGNFFGFFLVAFIATYAATASGEWNPYVSVYQATTSLTAILLIFVSGMLAMVIINMYNAYAGGYSMLNSLPSLGRIRSTICFCLLGTFLSCFPVFVEEAKDYISMIGYLLGPVIGVVAADFILIKKKTIDLQILTGRYDYNKRAIIMIFLGVILALLLPESWIPGAIAFIVSSIGYSLWAMAATRSQKSETSELQG